MDDKFLDYYNHELVRIRKHADRFATQNPKIADRLRMNPGYIDDPHVARIIEAFAFLTAQLHLKVDDDFSQISETLLQQMYPHYVKTIPAMSIVQFEASKDLAAPYFLAKGSLLRAATTNEVECRFQTCYATTLLPIELVSAKLDATYNREQQILAQNSNIKATLSLRFSALDSTFNISALRQEKLRLFINLNYLSALKCHELLNNAVESIIFKSAGGESSIGIAPNIMIQPVGFAHDHNLLPYPKNSLMAYRLLTEYFVFPEKYLFIDITLAPQNSTFDFGSDFTIEFFLNSTHSELEKIINKNSFLLGCTPIANLFPITAEPIHYDNKAPYYYIIPDARKRNQYDIIDIENITVITEDNEMVSCLPFYALTHSEEGQDIKYYWQTFSLSPLENLSEYHTNPSMKIALVNLNTQKITDSLVVNVDLLCSNGKLVRELPFGDGQRTLQLIDASPAIKTIKSIRKFTKSISSQKRKDDQWRFLSHLQLNYLSLAGSDEAVKSFRELLTLYDFHNSDDTKKMINSIISISTKMVTKRGPASLQQAMCSGVSITLMVDAGQYKESSCYLFTSILRQFFTLYVTINTFVELTVISNKQDEVIFQWPATIGSKQLI